MVLRNGPLIRAAVTLAGTQTLTNKTLTAPAISQVVFPATQVASAGANTLDDYEEGTWTPTLIGSSTAGAQTYGVQVGTYVKIGGIVICSCKVTISAKDAAMAGSARIGGLPFTSITLTDGSWSAAPAIWENITFAAGYVVFGGLVTSNTSYVELVELGTTKAAADIAVSELGVTTGIHLTIAYRVA